MKTLLLLLVLSDAAALVKARLLWGQAAVILKLQSAAAPGKWDYRVGCELAPGLVLAGRGISWDKAFGSVKLERNGPHMLSFDGLVWFVDGVPVGTGWSTVWDTTKGVPAAGPGMLIHTCNP